MNIETLIDQGSAIVYDRDVVKDPAPGMFQLEFWQSSNGVAGSAPGRGVAYFLDTPFGEVLLRRYRRGGWAARLSEDRYLFTGFQRSRPFREFHLLVNLFRMGLPVPEPLAALCEKSDIRYRGALMTRTIADVTPLADALVDGLRQEVWARVGRCIRRFHDAGVWHADLNVRNILLQGEGSCVYLVDFDRGKLRAGGPIDGRSNLARLRRSLEKWWPKPQPGEVERGWGWLMEGYRG